MKGRAIQLDFVPSGIAVQAATPEELATKTNAAIMAATRGELEN
jgi:hypothetical protein